MIGLLMDLKKQGGKGLIPGSCANCTKDVFEHLFTLDDAYNVWIGKCPHCGALNYLSMNHGLRGYSSQRMWLVLPTDEEKQTNDLPTDCPTQGSKGPATYYGSPAGEIYHRLTEN